MPSITAKLYQHRVTFNFILEAYFSFRKMDDGRHFLTGIKFTKKMKQEIKNNTDAYVKRQAKKIKKEQDITHIQALDLAAMKAGFANFKNFQNNLKTGNASNRNSKDDKVISKDRNPFLQKKVLDPYRNLLVAGINELLKNKLISLESSENKHTNDEKGHFFADVLGFPSVVKWRDISFGELEISVWWKYDHSKHPQAEHTGRSRENFNNTSPLARRELFKNFVGVTVTGWFERDKGKHLMGENRECFVDIYTRKGEKSALEKIPTQLASGFAPEGKLYF